MEDRIAKLTAEIEELKEQLHAEQKLTEIFKQGKQAGAEINALINGLKESGLDEAYVKEIIKAGIRQGCRSGGILG